MKASNCRLLLPVVAAGMLVSGCAAVRSGDEAVARHEVDREYVATVERSARSMPVKIIWVNPPTRRVESTAKVDFTIELPDNKD